MTDRQTELDKLRQWHITGVRTDATRSREIHFALPLRGRRYEQGACNCATWGNAIWKSRRQEAQ